jgi:hypothetical protein
MKVTVAGVSIENSKGHIVDEESFRPITLFWASPSPYPPSSTKSAKEPKSWISARQFYLKRLVYCSYVEIWKGNRQRNRQGKRTGMKRMWT